MEGALKCNIRKCRKVLSSGQVWVTSCSHLFCPDDGEKYVVQEKKCPVCAHMLTGKLDIVRMDLNPSEAFKSMVLCGLHPDVVMDISTRAVTFWMFQYRQEYLLKEHHLNKMSDKFGKMEKYCNKMMSNWQLEAKALDTEVHKYKNELEVSKKQCEELNQMLREKTRQLQKLQSSYSAHRHSSLQPKRPYSPHSLQTSPKRRQNPQFGSNSDVRQQTLSAFDIQLGVGKQFASPQKEKSLESSAFFFNAASVQSSPYVGQGDGPGARSEEDLSRKLFL